MQSYLKNMRELVGESFLPTELYSFFAMPNCGKTVYLIGEVINLMHNDDVRVLWIDTEGGFKDMWTIWRDRFMTRFGMKSFNENNFYYKRTYSYPEIMEFLGKSVEMDFSSNKSTLYFHGNVKKGTPNVYDDFGKKRDKTLIVLDSMTNVFNMGLVTNTQNFPIRSDATGLLINALYELSDKVNAPIFISNHASLNPTNPYEVHPHLKGGSMMYYSSKYVTLIEKPKKKVLEDIRKVYAVRSPYHKEWSKYVWLKLSENGYEDVTEAEIDEIATGKSQ